ncbi:MAG TPA: SAM-dependent methyltransferase, partial [Verrucomicrobiota bacterium]|nr:SAM-dependent methyltransferase [Verrucomicrobiota bacterium]
MHEPPVPIALDDQLRREIAHAGSAISFAQFMELALYAPGVGYYEQSAQVVGKRGDFFTSVSVGPVFGELLAFQFCQWLDELPPPWHLVEAGAHDGRLAADILGWFRTHRPEQAREIQLWLVEPSPTRREWQGKTLAEFGDQVQFAQDLASLALGTGGVRGVIYSNELLDAFPVHRVRWDSKSPGWYEVGVTWNGARFAWQPLPRVSASTEAGIRRLNRLPPELLQVLPDGFTTELSAAAPQWWRQAAEIVRSGWLMTAD